MEARHAKRWRGDAADSHRQTDRQNQRLTISPSSVTSSAGALTLHLLRLHHLREKPLHCVKLTCHVRLRNKMLIFLDESEAPVVTVRAARRTERGELVYCVSVRAELDRCPAK